MKSILIVGGGSAGWMAAAYLNHVLRRPGGEEPIGITVVESEDIGTIGVGEATIPTLRNFLRNIDVPEWRFLLDTNASFKHGIRFLDWMQPPAGRPVHEYFHLFEHPAVFEGYGVGTHWVALRDRGVSQPPFWDAVGVQAELCRRLKSPKPYDAMPYESPVPYAYHIDAAKFGGLLRSIATRRGVRCLRDTVIEVHKTPKGGISHVTTRDNGDLSADFFVDASGFRSILLGGALREPFESWSDYLLCDRAVACQTPHEQEVPKLRPYTTATAKESGWIWDIDLFSRRGSGYVYSSRHSTADDADRILREHLGPRGASASTRCLQMEIGHRRNMWVENCLGVGLAAGFVEPLESTGIYLVETALSLFIDHICDGPGAPYLASRFNLKMRQIYEELRDFLQIHYVLTDREDSRFWRDYRREVKMSDSLKYRLDLWTFKLPSLTDLDGHLALFGPANYSYILAGMNRLPPGINHASPFISPTRSAKALRVVEEARERLAAAYPNHYEYLKKQRSVARESPAA